MFGAGTIGIAAIGLKYFGCSVRRLNRAGPPSFHAKAQGFDFLGIRVIINATGKRGGMLQSAKPLTGRRNTMEFRDRHARFLLRKLWKDCVGFHGKPCTLLAVGVRVCETALAKLGLEAPDGDRLVCVSEHDGCCVDAIQIGLHCTIGKKHLLFYKTGKLVFTVYDLLTGQSVRMCTRPEIEEQIHQMSPEDILALPEDRLFCFEEARPMTQRVKTKVYLACSAATEGIPPRSPGIQDCPDQFRSFDLQK